MVEVVVSEGQVSAVTSRRFEGLYARCSEEMLSVYYVETTTVDGTVVKQETKTYSRDFEFWKQSQLGQAIIELVNEDLSQQDPAAPRQ